MFKVAFAFSMWMFLCLWREVYELNEPMECIISSTVAITGRRILLIMNLFKTLRNDPYSAYGIEGGYTQYFGGKSVPSPNVEIAFYSGAIPTFI
jgi:hypothetical protein